MDEPFSERDRVAFADGRPSFVRAARIVFDDKPELAHARLKRIVRTALIAACVAAAAAGWCAALHVSADMLDAAAVMALMETSNPRGANARPLVSHDPHFAELTPVGFELIATRTRQAGRFAHIDEYDYRNADGDAVILLIAFAPLASEQQHWSARRVGEIRLLSWTASGQRYVLAGRADTRALMRAADALTLSSGR
jgi:hypothetical protein